MVRNTSDSNSNAARPAAFYRLIPASQEYLSEEFHGFFAAGLTQPNNVPQEDYEIVKQVIGPQVERAFKSLGLSCYLPVKVTEPHNGVPREDVDSIIRWLIKDRVRCLVAYERLASNGVGVEVEMARDAKKPIIRLRNVSQSAVHGESRPMLPDFQNPDRYSEVTYDNPHEISDKLWTPLFYLFSLSALDEACEEDDWTRNYRDTLKADFEESVAAAKYRHLRTTPISKEEWKEWPIDLV